MAESTAERIEKLHRRMPTKAHGDRLRYLQGCKCFRCKLANADYQWNRRRAIQRGEGNPDVSAEAARLHLLYLAREGVGLRAVAKAADLNRKTVQLVRNRGRGLIRKKTADAILGVSRHAALANAAVDGRRTLARIARLVHHGWTRKAIAFSIGKHTPALQVGRVYQRAASGKVAKRNHDAIRALYVQEFGSAVIPSANNLLILARLSSGKALISKIVG